MLACCAALKVTGQGCKKLIVGNVRKTRKRVWMSRVVNALNVVVLVIWLDSAGFLYLCREAGKVGGDRPISPRFRPASPRRRRSRSPYRQEFGYRRRSPSPRYDYYRGGRGYSPVYYQPDRDYYRYEDEYRYREREYYERELEPRDGARDRDPRLDAAVRDPRMETPRDPRMETMERPDVPRDPREGAIGRDPREIREPRVEGGRDAREIRDPREQPREGRDPREQPREGRDPRLENRDFDPRRADYYYGFNRDQYLKR